MIKQAFYLPYPIFPLMFSLLSVGTAKSNQHNFNSITSYESSVNSLFTSLVSLASISNFNTSTSSTQSDIVYGLFQCRGDLNSSSCTECVASSVSQLKTTCPTSVGGTIQLEDCFVKYNNTLFFGVVDKKEMLKSCGPSVGCNSDVSDRIDDALKSLVSGWGQYFRKGSVGSIQVLAQCVQDLNGKECQDCFSEASKRLRSQCKTSIWGDMYLGKCYIQYNDQGNISLLMVFGFNISSLIFIITLSLSVVAYSKTNFMLSKNKKE